MKTPRFTQFAYWQWSRPPIATEDIAQRVCFFSWAKERLRVLGEIPVRKFGTSTAELQTTADGQLLDPDGNPDTSFLAKIPADVAFTFQTIDRQGLVLNKSQTWHQLRPGKFGTTAVDVTLTAKHRPISPLGTHHGPTIPCSI